MKILQTVTLISLLTVGGTSPLLSMDIVDSVAGTNTGHPPLCLLDRVDLTMELGLLSTRSTSPATAPDVSPILEKTFTERQEQQKKIATPKAPTPQPSCIKRTVNGIASAAWYLLRLGPAIDGGYYLFSTLRYCCGLAPVAEPAKPKQETLEAKPQADEAASLKDLVNSRLNKDLIMCSKSYVFSGESGTFYNPFSQRCIQSKAPVSSLFSSRNNEIMSLTLYEMLEIFLDTTFGLQPGIEGVPPPEQRTGSLGTLLKCKLDFTIGPKRDGNGQPYGKSKTPNHFSDWEKSTGHFDCGKRINRIFPSQRPRSLSPAERMEAAAAVSSSAKEKEIDPFRIASGGNIVSFCNAHEAVTDYARLVALSSMLTTAPSQA